jgi:hypothetical protein
MKRLMGVILGLAIAMVIVGFFRGWFALSKTAEETTTDIHLRIDRQRIKEDLDAARDKVDQLRDRESEDAGETGVEPLEIPQDLAP